MKPNPPKCSHCGRLLHRRSYQHETGGYVATGKFPTHDFCNLDCAESFHKALKGEWR